jgi:F-box and WD-40 domain protein 7
MRKTHGLVKISDFYSINDILPSDVLLKVFTYSDPYTVKSVCKKWFMITHKNDILWKDWYNTKFNSIIYHGSWKEKYMKMYQLELNWINLKYNYIHFNECSWLTSCSLNEDYLITTSKWGIIKVWDLEKIKKKKFSNALPKSFVGNLGPINCVNFNGDIIVSGSFNGSIKIWNLNSNYYIKMLTYHTEEIYCLHLYKDYIISGSRDTNIFIYNYITEETECLEGHTDSVWSIDTDKDGNIYSCSLDGTVRIWTKNDNNYKNKILKISDYAVLKLIIYNELIIIGTWNGTIEIWNKNKRIFSMKTHQTYVSGMKLINNFLITSGNNNQVKIWKINKQPEINIELINIINNDKVSCLDVTDKELVTCTIDGKINYYNFSFNIY